MLSSGHHRVDVHDVVVIAGRRLVDRLELLRLAHPLSFQLLLLVHGLIVLVELGALELHTLLHLDAYRALVGLLDERAGERVAARATREYDGVLGIVAPVDEQIAREAHLEVGRAGQDELILAGRLEAAQFGERATQLDVLEVERIVAADLERLHDLVVHPLDLRLGEVDDADRHVVEERDRVGEQARVLVLPQLVEKVRQLEHAARRVRADEHRAVVAQRFEYALEEAFVAVASLHRIVGEVERVGDEQRRLADRVEHASIQMSLKKTREHEINCASA